MLIHGRATRLALMATLMLSSLPALSATLQIEDPCGDTPWLSVTVPHDKSLSAGAATVLALETYKIDFVGSESGIVSIKDSISGSAAMEIVGPNEMRAYGWCYSFNGVEPNVYASDVAVDSANDSIRWYFGYAHYKNGEWIAMCVPTHIEKPEIICGKAK